MGVSYNAFAVVGSKIDKAEMSEEVDVRACVHTLPDERMKFCPECGRTAYEKGTEFIPAYDEYHRGNKTDATLAGLPVFDGEGEGDFILVAGAYAKVDDYDQPTAVIPQLGNGMELEAAKKKVKDALEPIGLWDEDRFGIWLMLSCSC